MNEMVLRYLNKIVPIQDI